MKRILLVDDDPDVLQSLASVLEDGYDVGLARNGEDALRRIRSEHFDAILLDLAMPEKDGVAVIREMNAGGIRVPVVLVSGSADLAAKARALSVREWLSKPFTVAQLEEKVAAVLGERPSLRVAAAKRVRPTSTGGGDVPAPTPVFAGAARGEGAVPMLQPARVDATRGRFAPPETKGGFEAPLVERARALMEARNEVLSELQHLPPDAFLLECARRLGVLNDGALDEACIGDACDQLAFVDFCAYAFESRGRGALELYRAQRKPKVGTLEDIVSSAMAHARFSLWEVRKGLGADGALLCDLITGERARVIDEDVACLRAGTLIAARVMTFDDFALLTAPCRPLEPIAARAARTDLAQMNTEARARLATTERVAQTDLACWLLRAAFASAQARRDWPAPHSVARH